MTMTSQVSDNNDDYDYNDLSSVRPNKLRVMTSHRSSNAAGEEIQMYNERKRQLHFMRVIGIWFIF